MILNLDEQTQKKLNNVEFVESVTNNVETQNVLLESLNSDEQSEGRFKNAEDMFAHMMKEWEDEKQ